MTTGKTALTLRTFVGRVMSLLFNTLSRFVLAFLPRSQRLLISWLQWFQWVITYYYHCLYWWLLLSLVWPVGALSGCLHVSTCHVSSFLGTFLLSGSVTCCRLILYFESSWISHDSSSCRLPYIDRLEPISTGTHLVILASVKAKLPKMTLH